jgi:hypothetical protein
MNDSRFLLDRVVWDTTECNKHRRAQVKAFANLQPFAKRNPLCCIQDVFEAVSPDL